MDRAYHERVREGFLAIARAEPERCRVIDAAPPEALVARGVRAAVQERFGLDLVDPALSGDMEISDPPPEPRANPDLVGQDAAQAVLARALRSGRLPHGWLLSGPEGIGKATLALPVCACPARRSPGRPVRPSAFPRITRFSARSPRAPTPI